MEQVSTETLKPADSKVAVAATSTKLTEKPAVSKAVPGVLNEKTGEVKGSPQDEAALDRKAKIKAAAYALIDALDEADQNAVDLTHRVINETFSLCRKAARASDLKTSGWDPFAPLTLP